MNCKGIKKRFLIDCLEEGLESDQKTLIEDHLVNCPQCREHFEEIQRIGHLLKSYIVPDPGEAFWDRLSSKIYSRVNKEQPAQKKLWGILQDWMTWKRLAYAAVPILLIFLFFPAYYLYQPHFRKLTHEENILAVQEIVNGFPGIEESLVQLPANQLDELLQKVAGLILDTQILFAPGSLTGIEWDINEEVSQMHKEKLELLIKSLKV